MEKESLGDIFDSDVTVVTDSQEIKHKKHNKVQREDTQNLSIQASQSLLKVKKKKKKKETEVSEEYSIGVQSQSMLTQIKQRDSYFTDDSDILRIAGVPKKSKRKNSCSQELSIVNNNEPPNKKKKDLNDFSSQDIFQSSSKDFVSSTPKDEKHFKLEKNTHSPVSDSYQTAQFKKDKGHNLNTLSQSGNTPLKNGYRNVSGIKIDLNSSGNEESILSQTDIQKEKKRKQKDLLNKNTKTLLENFLETCHWTDNARWPNYSSSGVIHLESDDSSSDNRIGKMENSRNSSKTSEKRNFQQIDLNKKKHRKQKKSLNQVIRDNGKHNRSANSTEISYGQTALEKKRQIEQKEIVNQKSSNNKQNISVNTSHNSSFEQTASKKKNNGDQKEGVSQIIRDNKQYNNSNISEESRFEQTVIEKKKKKQEAVNQITKGNGQLNSSKASEENSLEQSPVKKEKKRKHVEVNQITRDNEHINTSITSEANSFKQTPMKKEKKRDKRKLDIYTSSEESSFEKTSIKKEKKRKHEKANQDIGDNVQPHSSTASEENTFNQTPIKKEKKRKHEETNQVTNDKRKLNIYTSSEESSSEQTPIKKEKKRKQKAVSELTRNNEQYTSSETKEECNFQQTAIKKSKKIKQETANEVTGFIENNNHLKNGRKSSFEQTVLEKRNKENKQKMADQVIIDNERQSTSSVKSSGLTQEIENDSHHTETYSRRNSSAYSDSFDDSDSGLDEKIDPLEIKRVSLKNLVIRVKFPVPKLHLICNRASKPTPQQRSRAFEEKLPIKNGKFVKAEDVQIMENWKKFIEIYKFEDDPEVFYCLDKKYISVKEKQKFLFFLAQSLPERTPYSVFQRFRVLTRVKKKGRFTVEEDQYILKNMEATGCTEIAQRLERSLASVEKRIERLKDVHTRKIRWKKGNLAAFIKYLLKVTKTDPDEVENLKNRDISCEEWKRLSGKLDRVPVRILKRAWLVTIHPKLFIPDKCCDLREVKLKLVNMFDENKEHDWRSVNWNKYASYFEGLTPLRIYSLLKTLVDSKVPREKRNNLKRCIKILKTCTKKDLQAHVIYKVKYKDGKIIDL